MYFFVVIGSYYGFFKLNQFVWHSICELNSTKTDWLLFD